MSVSCCNQSSSETIPFSQLAAEIGISLSGVAEPIVIAAIYRASTQFLSKTQALQQRIRLDYQRHTKDYPVEPDDCYTLITIKEVWLDGCQVAKENWGQTVDRWLELSDCMTNYCDGTKFEVEVTVGLSRNACLMPVVLYERWGDAIMNLALAQLYGMHGEEWYDPNLVRFYGGIGQQGIKDAKSLIQLEQNGGEIPMRGVEMIL